MNRSLTNKPACNIIRYILSYSLIEDKFLVLLEVKIQASDINHFV